MHSLLIYKYLAISCIAYSPLIPTALAVVKRCSDTDNENYGKADKEDGLELAAPLVFLFLFLIAQGVAAGDIVLWYRLFKGNDGSVCGYEHVESDGYRLAQSGAHESDQEDHGEHLCVLSSF